MPSAILVNVDPGQDVSLNVALAIPIAIAIVSKSQVDKHVCEEVEPDIDCTGRCVEKRWLLIDRLRIVNRSETNTAVLNHAIPVSGPEYTSVRSPDIAGRNKIQSSTIGFQNPGVH